MVHSSAAFVMGLFLGHCAVATGSVIPALVAHIVNNIVATLAPDYGADTTAGRLAAVAGGLAIAVAAAWLLSRDTTRSRVAAPES